MKNRFILYLIIFIIAAVLINIAFYLYKLIWNKFLLSLIFALIITLIVVLLRTKKEFFEPSKGLIRYTMLCRNCGWEWMSNISKEGSVPTTCPSCHDKTRLEITGWRKIKPLTKIDKDLRSFFK